LRETHQKETTMTLHQAEIDAATARAAIFAAMPAALTEASGTRWIKTPGPARHRDREHDASDPRGIYAQGFRRVADLFEIFISRSEAGRVASRIEWPVNPTDPTRHASYRDAPGVRYDADAPGCTSAMTRGAPAIAKQALRTLDLPEYVAAFHAIAKRWAADADKAAQAALWLEAVAEASGATLRKNPSNSGHHFALMGKAEWAREIKGETSYPGGSVKIDLPRDPQDAAAMVRRLRAAVEA
jgi:hypothetical protein